MGQVIEKTQCPECSKHGNDTSHDNLIKYDDGGAKCFACGYVEFKDGMTQTHTTYTLPPHTSLPNTGWASKGISLTTCNRFGMVHLSHLDDNGLPLTKPNQDGSHSYIGSGILAFPYYDISTNTQVAAKLRQYGKKQKNNKGEDTTHDVQWFEGDTSRVSWYGVNAVPASATKLVLVEGESDTLSVAQACPDVAVLGCPAGSERKAIQASLHVFRKYKSIVVAFDNDAAGKAATERALEILPKGKVYVTHLPADVKDWNELLLTAGAVEIQRHIRNATHITPKGVSDSAALRKRTLDYLFNRETAKGATTGFESLDKAMGGLAPGKLLTLCGGTGSGKSTVAESIAVNAAVGAGINTFFIPLEMTDSQVMSRMVQQILRQPIASDPYFDTNTIDRKGVETAVAFLDEHIKFYDHFGALDMETLIDVCEFAIDAYDTKLVVLDHITAASEGLDWKDLDNCAKKLKALAIRKNVCVVTVNHISRDGNNEDTVPSLKHIRGGNGVAQYSDCVLGIGRKRDSNVMSVRTIKVDRMVGKFVEFELKYDSCKLVETGVISHTLPEEVDDYEFTDTQVTSHDTHNGNTVRGEDSERSQGEVQEQVRTGHTGVKPTPGVRVADRGVPQHTQVHTRLADTTHEHRGREQRSDGRGRQSQAIVGESSTPRVRCATSISKRWTETIAALSNNVH